MQSCSLGSRPLQYVTEGCVTWEDERKALSRVGVDLYDCEIRYKLMLLTVVERWFDQMMFFFLMMVADRGEVRRVEGVGIRGARCSVSAVWIWVRTSRGWRVV